MLDDFLIRAALGGAGVAVAAGPLGAFVVWRRMAYFGDATAHAAILGVALSLALGLPVTLGALIVALAVALLVLRLTRRGQTADAALGVVSHSALAVGLVAIAFVPGVRADPQAFLFGDVLAIGRGQVAVIWAGAAGVAAMLWWRWDRMLVATLNPDLARSAGIDPAREELALTLGLAVVVAVAMQVVGALLTAALMIVPAAAARGFARSPEAMALGAAAIGLAAVEGGLAASLLFDSPAGPSIVVVAAALYAVSLAAGAWRRP